jgi:hypothetical protein
MKIEMRQYISTVMSRCIKKLRRKLERKSKIKIQMTKGWWHVSSGGVLALQAQGPKFKIPELAGKFK